MRRVFHTWGESLIYGEIWDMTLGVNDVNHTSIEGNTQMLVDRKSCEVLNASNDDLVLGRHIGFVLPCMSEACINLCV